MAEPFVGEIRFFSFDFPPHDWMPCDGRLLPIAQNQALFALLGTTFGGDGRVTFGVPDLRGRVPMHANVGTPQGTQQGAEDVTLFSNQMPAHYHFVAASSATGTEKNYENALFATASGSGTGLYAAPGNLQALNPATVSSTGGSRSHPNCQPSLVGNYCIAITGTFPSRN